MMNSYSKNVDYEVWKDSTKRWLWNVNGCYCVGLQLYHNDMVSYQWCVREVTCDWSGPQAVASAEFPRNCRARLPESWNKQLHLFSSYTYSDQIQIVKIVFLVNIIPELACKVTTDFQNVTFFYNEPEFWWWVLSFFLSQDFQSQLRWLNCD